ncbi:MAG: hypothetical protein WBL40_01390 [Terrimicrobiaceae bacterium]
MHSAFLASYTPSAPPEEFGTRGEEFNKDMDGTRCNHLLALAAGHTAADKRIRDPTRHRRQWQRLLHSKRKNQV